MDGHDFFEKQYQIIIGIVLFIPGGLLFHFLDTFRCNDDIEEAEEIYREKERY